MQQNKYVVLLIQRHRAAEHYICLTFLKSFMILQPQAKIKAIASLARHANLGGDKSEPKASL